MLPLLMTQKYIKWLKDELPKLTQENIITDEIAEKIHQHYQMDELLAQQSLSFFTIILASIGSLLIGGGIILIFAYNWDNIDRPMRTVLAFTPLVIAQILTVMALYPKKRGTAWREVAGVLLFFGVAAAISIIGQTYHISGDFQGFITWWYLLILPVVYVLRAHLMTMLMIVLAGYAAINFSPIYLLFLIALLPYYIQIIDQGNNTKTIQTGWVWAIAVLCSVPFQLFPNTSDKISLLIMFSLSSCFYLISSVIEKNQATWKRPVTIFSALTLGGFLILLSFNDAAETIFHIPLILNNQLEEGYQILITLLVLSAILIAYQAHLRNFKVLILPSILPLYIVLGFAFGSSSPTETFDTDWQLTFISLIFTLTAIFISGWYIYLGIKEDSASKLNYGLILIVGLVMFKFFIDDFSLVIRGTAFIVVGATLIITNIWHNRRSVS